MRANGRSVIFHDVPNIEGELLPLLCEYELHQVTHFVSDELQTLQGDVFHVGRICHLVDERQLGGYLRDGRFLLQGLCNLADFVLALGALDFLIYQRELDIEDQDVEAESGIVCQVSDQNGGQPYP